MEWLKYVLIFISYFSQFLIVAYACYWIGRYDEFKEGIEEDE